MKTGIYVAKSKHGGCECDCCGRLDKVFKIEYTVSHSKPRNKPKKRYVWLCETCFDILLRKMKTAKGSRQHEGC